MGDEMKYVVWYDYYDDGGYDSGLPDEYSSEEEAADRAAWYQATDGYVVQGVSIIDGETVANIPIAEWEPMKAAELRYEIKRQEERAAWEARKASKPEPQRVVFQSPFGGLTWNLEDEYSDEFKKHFEKK